MILWVADRFGMPGHFHRIWLRLLLTTGHQPPEFRIHKLSDALKRTLLTKLGSRKAPTWIPDEAPHIIAQIDRWCDQYKPRAVVLSSPESLAYLAMAPEHATLHNLRGSVYWRRGIPFIVSLPISAWATLVSQKDVGAANYGFDSAEAFGAARSENGEVYEDSDQRISRGLTQRDNDIDGRGLADSNQHAADEGRPGNVNIESNPSRSPSGAGKQYGRTLPPAWTRIDIRSSDDEVERAESAIAAEQLDQADLSSDDDDGEDLELDGSSDDSVDSSGNERDPGDSGGDLSPVTDGEDDVDRFFYEPVLSPVGRFALTADMMKLARVLEFGRRSDGPEKPIVLRY